KNNQNEIKITLRDVDKHWAKKNVWKLNMEGVIKGYEDGSFQPEKSVSKAESVVMAVRLLGLEAEANTKINAQLPFKDAAAIPAWAVGYIAMALEKGIIDQGNDYFQPDKAATRMDATTILVRSLGKPVNSQVSEAQLKFTDVRTISTDAQNYIAMAVLNNLIKGYEDGSFRPAGSVTRAELATIFDRAQERNELGINKFRLKGTLTAVSASESIVSVNTGVYDAVYDAVYSGSKNYKVISGAAIYRNDQAVELVSLKPQDNVELLLNKVGDIVFIDAKEPAQAEEQNLLKGFVTQVEAVNKTLKVLLSGVLEVRYAVAGDAVIMREGKTAAFSAIQVHDRVEMVQNPQGLIAKIKAVPVTKKSGVVISFVKNIKYELKGKGAKIKLEQKVENRKLKYKVELIKLG
ncbi:MAG: S-layer homology domain-containing protein, partial [Carboxydocellales bacterium]